LLFNIFVVTQLNEQNRVQFQLYFDDGALLFS